METLENLRKHMFSCVNFPPTPPLSASRRGPSGVVLALEERGGGGVFSPPAKREVFTPPFAEIFLGGIRVFGEIAGILRAQKRKKCGGTRLFLVERASKVTLFPVVSALGKFGRSGKKIKI